MSILSIWSRHNTRKKYKGWEREWSNSNINHSHRSLKAAELTPTAVFEILVC